MTAWIDSTLLLIVAAAAILHLNATRRSAWCERVGFAITSGGAFGVMAEYWVPQVGYWADFILHLGIAIVAIALVRGELRTFFVGWTGVDRRQHSLSATEFIDRRFQERR